jgi:CYTH domain-containing protein
MKDLDYKIQFERTFLLQDLPEPLTRSSEHLQFFDNFIEKTRLCLRTVRVPKTDQYTYILEQRFPVDNNDLSAWKVSKIYLNETEHKAFEMFEGRQIKKNERVETNEIRFNRYLFEKDGRTFEIDVFLNREIWGLILARVLFESIENMQAFKKPAFAEIEVTNNKFFVGENLIGKSFADVREEFFRAVESKK